MTKLWGPLGWMTLHSVSLIYPASPTPEEKTTANRFLDLFADSISCPNCKNHFKKMLELYKLSFPNFLDSRQNFAIFVFRAHNTVNARIDKPLYPSVSECLKALQLATSQTSFAQFRNSYVSYLLSNWGRESGGDAMMVRRSVKDLQKIVNEYWNPRDTGLIPEIEDDDVLYRIENDNVRFTQSWRPISTAVGFKGGKLKLGKM